MRTWWVRLGVGVLGLVAWGVAGCQGQGSPCTDCPNISGSWSLELRATTIADDCPSVATPDASVVFEQTGPNLTAQFGGGTLHGTMYDTWDLAVSGSAPGDGGLSTLTLTARYVPGLTDGGTDKLVGTYSGSIREGQSFCRQVRDLTGTRAP